MAKVTTIWARMTSGGNGNVDDLTDEEAETLRKQLVGSAATMD